MGLSLEGGGVYSTGVEIISRSVEETLALGRRVGALCEPGMCITLSGPLGAGKTHFVRGLAEGAGVADVGLVSSPTYVLLNIYPADARNAEAKAVYHLDAYRLAGGEDLGTQMDLEEDCWRPRGFGGGMAAAPVGLLPEDRLGLRLSRWMKSYGGFC